MDNRDVFPRLLRGMNDIIHPRNVIGRHRPHPMDEILHLAEMEIHHMNRLAGDHPINPRGLHHGRRPARYERINVEGDVLSYVPNDDGHVAVYMSCKSLTAENNYFEVEILDTGENGTIGVGLVHLGYPLDRQPGWNQDSVGFHADDGAVFKGNGYGRRFGPKSHIGDKIGCGIKFDQIVEDHEENPDHHVPVFFTRNGKEVGTVIVSMPKDGFYPAVGMHSDGEEVRLNLDAEFHQNDVTLMSVDDYEEEWARLHDIRLNGQILEYTGRGKSIVDVGLAQARFPLDTCSHYFEIEVMDPGESCYIAIGLARKDYPKHRHPGWNRGSIAYHADDGKIFVGSGAGDPFGPKCAKGDIMGCGILFPRDYNSDQDSDSSDSSPDHAEPNHHRRHHNLHAEELLDLENCPSSDSEDEEWWMHRPNVENGTKVQVFFTRNGETIGSRDVRIPKGGFYPTVGMLSSDEKVRVDLRPLTG